MENIPECFYRVSVKGLILNEGKKFLLAKESYGLWELPGGGLDHGELPHSGLIREIKEEMGLEVVKIKELPSYFLTTLNRAGIWAANIIFEVTVKDLNFIPSPECLEIGFFTSEEAKDLRLQPNVEKFIEVFNPDNHG